MDGKSAVLFFFNSDMDKIEEHVYEVGERFIEENYENNITKEIAREFLEKNVYYLREVKSWADPIEGVPIAVVNILTKGLTAKQIKFLKIAEEAIKSSSEP